MNANIVHVQRLPEGSRAGLERHFLSLEPEDVRLRFGANIAAAAIRLTAEEFLAVDAAGSV